MRPMGDPDHGHFAGGRSIATAATIATTVATTVATTASVTPAIGTTVAAAACALTITIIDPLSLGTTRLRAVLITSTSS